MTASWSGQLLALVIKEFQQIVRDPSSYLVGLILPLLFLLLFGYGITLDPGLLKIAVYDESRTTASTEIAADFARSPWFSSVPTQDMEHASRAMRDAEIQGVLHIRSDFDARIAEGSTGSIQLIVDGTEPNIARFIQNYGSSLIARHLAIAGPTGKPTQPRIQATPYNWFNPTAKSLWFLVPGSITVIMTLIGTLLTSLVFAKEWERGTMEAMLATPISRLQLLLGKLIPYFCLGMLSMCLCAGFAVFQFGVPFRGSIPTLLLVSSVFMLCALGQGMLISVLIRSQLVASEAGMFTGFLPALMLSGFVFDISSMAEPLQILTQIIPASHFNICLRSIFLAGDLWEVILPQLAELLLLASVMLFIVWRKLTKRID